MKQKIRVGVIGTSWYADMLILPSLQSHPQAELAAICGRDQARADEVAAEYSIPKVYADYQEMIGQGALDAVVVATPDDLHYEMTMWALSAGLHVQCDMPLAVNLCQARRCTKRPRPPG